MCVNQVTVFTLGVKPRGTRPALSVDKTPDGSDRKSAESGAPEPPDSNASEETDDGGEEIPVVHYNCERCGHTATTGLGLATLDHPAVQGFYYEHGIDIRDRPVWDFPALAPDHMTVLSRDPLRASVTHITDGATLTLVLNEDADTIEVQA